MNGPRCAETAAKTVIALTIMIAPCSPLLAQPAAIIARWEFDGDYLTANHNPSYDLDPGGGVALVSSPRGMAADFHGGACSISDIATLSCPALSRLDSREAVTSASFNGGFSIMAWVKRYSDSASDNTYVLSHDSSSYGTGKRGFGFHVDSTVRLLLRDVSDHRLMAQGALATPIGPGRWYHVAVTWDGSDNGGVTFYVDGRAVETTLITGGAFAGLNGVDPFPIRIGAHQGAADQHVAAFDGGIDHLSFYTGVLTAAEVEVDYLRTRCAADLNMDGQVDFGDYLEFLDMFDAGC